MNIISNSYESDEDSHPQSPAIGQMNDDSLSETADEIENGLVPEKVVNRLTSLVREQYHAYLEKLLKENYEAWCAHQAAENNGSPSEDWIKKCASMYEEKALKSCMIVQFYRKSMLKIIANIRRETLHGKLAQKLRETNEEKKPPIKVETLDAFTQTEEDIARDKENGSFRNQEYEKLRISQSESLSLEEKIECFQRRLEEQERILREQEKHRSRLEKLAHKHKRKSSTSHERERKYMKPCTHVEESPVALSPHVVSPPPIDKPVPEKTETMKPLEEDEVAKELEMLFGGAKDEVDEIFGEGNCDPQIDQILKEIEQAKLPGNKEDGGTISLPQLEEQLSENPHKSVPVKEENILFESIWPCELHMRRQRLREVLMGVADRGIRCHARIKSRFLELFGEDSDDEFAVYSPSLELNEVLLASCKKRIAPWIVKHLMVPMKEGLIGNRFLFKKLAKRLATSIIMANQYPDENYIKSTVENFFCFRQTIMSIEDVESI